MITYLVLAIGQKKFCCKRCLPHSCISSANFSSRDVYANHHEVISWTICDCLAAVSTQNDRGDMMNERKTRNLDYLDKGVAVSPALPVVGDKITVFYDGILAKNGAEEITLHLGYGSNWDNEQAIPMVKKDTGFEATIPALKEDYLKLSFKDTFNNVDDNNGKGYSIEILK